MEDSINIEAITDIPRSLYKYHAENPGFLPLYIARRINEIDNLKYLNNSSEIEPTIEELKKFFCIKEDELFAGHNRREYGRASFLIDRLFYVKEEPGNTIISDEDIRNLPLVGNYDIDESIVLLTKLLFDIVEEEKDNYNAGSYSFKTNLAIKYHKEYFQMLIKGDKFGFYEANLGEFLEDYYNGTKFVNPETMIKAYTGNYSSDIEGFEIIDYKFYNDMLAKYRLQTEIGVLAGIYTKEDIIKSYN